MNSFDVKDTALDDMSHKEHINTFADFEDEAGLDEEEKEDIEGAGVSDEEDDEMYQHEVSYDYDKSEEREGEENQGKVEKEGPETESD